jgi:hypothetical protein
MDDWLAWMQWPAMAISLLAAWLIASKDAHKRVLAFVLLILGNLLWKGWGWRATAYALIVLNAGLLVLNVRGILKNETDSGAS